MAKLFQGIRARLSGVLAGGALLLVSSVIVNAGNYLFNLVLGRWLGPVAFADLSFVVTLMLVVTLVTGTLQTVVARFAALYWADGDTARLEGLYRWMGRLAWGVGGLLAVVLAVSSPALVALFRLASVWPLLILAVGLPIYFAQGVDRGMLQGATRFVPLALSYQAEMWARLGAGVVLVALGLAVMGASLALSLSFAASWLAAWWAWRSSRATAGVLAPAERREVLHYAGPVGLALAGQIVINNSDVLLVKGFFEPEAAGQYAALALIGRIVFFATWSVVTAIFPVVAQRHRRGEPHAHLLLLGLGLVAGTSVPIIAGALLAPDLAVRLLFGEAYVAVAPLLWLYALATALYALANVVVSYRLALGGTSGAALTLGAGVAQVLGIALFHADLRQVVLVQVFVMGGLFVILLARNGLAILKTHLSPRAQRWLARTIGLSLVALVLSGLAIGGQLRAANAGFSLAAAPNEAHRQVRRTVPSLIDSEAERATGVYVPGVGATFALDVLRGPNSAPGKPSYAGTHDWTIYLMQTFGPKLTAVPPEETIAFAVDYYDFASLSYHQIVVLSKAKTVADPTSYTVWLDGRLYADATKGAQP